MEKESEPQAQYSKNSLSEKNGQWDEFSWHYKWEELIPDDLNVPGNKVVNQNNNCLIITFQKENRLAIGRAALLGKQQNVKVLNLNEKFENSTKDISVLKSQIKEHIKSMYPINKLFVIGCEADKSILMHNTQSVDEVNVVELNSFLLMQFISKESLYQNNLEVLNKFLKLLFLLCSFLYYNRC